MDTSTAAKPGRPRDPETEARILDVALRHLARDGYSRMSMDAIAAEAGASKPTLYRRWASKADLATAAIQTIRFAEPPFDTGSTSGDLQAALANFSRSLLRPNGLSLIGTVLAEEEHTPDLIRLFRERLVVPRRAILHAILERARKRKELRANADLDAAVNLLVGAFYARYLSGAAITEDFSNQVVRIVWQGIRK